MTNLQEESGNNIINFCFEKDIYDLMSYFKIILGNNHILSNDLSFIKWQYFNKTLNRYNFIISKNKENKTINGVIGYIPNNFYGEYCEKKDYIWLSNWYAEKNTGALGIKLIDYLKRHEHNCGIGAINLTKEAEIIYKMLKYKIGKLNKYFIVNENIKEFKLIKYNEKNKNLNLDEKNNLKKYCFKKYNGDISFIHKKYVTHPYYNYFVYQIENNKNILAYIIFRISCYKSNCLLRLVDFIGDIEILSKCYYEFQNLLNFYNCEAMEFYCYGIDEKYLFKCGFKNAEYENIFIPYHFEPYSENDVILNFAVSGKNPKYIFKGDGDRERPGILKEVQ